MVIFPVKHQFSVKYPVIYQFFYKHIEAWSKTVNFIFEK